LIGIADVQDSDYLKLTEIALVQIFDDKDILLPMSDLDKRIEIRTAKNKNFESIKRAMEGETHLKVFTPSIKPRYRKFDKTELCKFVDI